MAELLKNEIGKSFVESLSALIVVQYSAFDREAFCADVLSSLESLELKERMYLVRDKLRLYLPRDYSQAIDVLIAATPGFSKLPALVFPEFVSAYGLKDWKKSMQALEVFTRLCSAEFAIRAFIELDAGKALKQMKVWTESEDEHLRRLASEGCRPYLPWATRVDVLLKSPEPILRILEALKADKSLYVRKSVANNLNDLSRLWPDTVLELAGSWKGFSKETDWTLKHGLRTLLKDANPSALELFGYPKPKGLSLDLLSLASDSIKIGSRLNVSLSLKRSKGKLGKLRLEYLIGYLKKNGSHSEKVFQIADAEFCESKRSWKFAQRMDDMTTRKHYPGSHYLKVRVNGVVKGRADFELVR
ncbi:DNA alkylation repair protein [Puniceicoccaceae bacterium K14]|nr:DNA alkylation repair protein [Puniceicoccaceae bacterium K14]